MWLDFVIFVVLMVASIVGVVYASERESTKMEGVMTDKLMEVIEYAEKEWGLKFEQAEEDSALGVLRTKHSVIKMRYYPSSDKYKIGITNFDNGRFFIMESEDYDIIIACLHKLIGK